jgi:ADP-heptose:LPS heptosyltransferase
MLKQQVNGAEIHFATKERHESLLEFNPYLEKVHLLGNNMNALIYDLKKEKFDYIIDLHNNFRSNKIRRRLRARTFAFKKLNWEKMLMVRMKINKLPKVHIVERYLETISSFDIRDDEQGLDFFIDEENRFKTEDLPQPFQNGFVAIVIAGTYFTKKFPPHKISEICQNIPYPVILLGGRNEYDEGEQILSQSKGNILNYAGKISLNKSASLVRDANVVLTNDTGLMHIAAAFHQKILSFWGNTIPEFGMYPYLPDFRSKALQISGLPCRPCSKLGTQKCPKKHFKCMENIDVNIAIEWILKNYQK